MPGVIRKYVAQVGAKSIVGACGTFPLSHGNYFWLASGTRVVNFWAENLDEIAKTALPDGMVEVMEWTWEKPKRCQPEVMETATACLIIDERIPKEWFDNSLCFTGSPGPTAEVAREMYEQVGDPDNKLEQYTDPASYWAKRGGKWDPRGFVTYATKPDDQTDPFIFQSKIRTGSDRGMFYCPYIPEGFKFK